MRLHLGRPELAFLQGPGHRHPLQPHPCAPTRPSPHATPRIVRTDDNDIGILQDVIKYATPLQDQAQPGQRSKHLRCVLRPVNLLHTTMP